MSAFIFEDKTHYTKHALKSYKTTRSLLWGGSLRTIPEIEGMNVSLAVAIIDDLALQELEIVVNLMRIPA